MTVSFYFRKACPNKFFFPKFIFLWFHHIDNQKYYIFCSFLRFYFSKVISSPLSRKMKCTLIISRTVINAHKNTLPSCSVNIRVNLSWVHAYISEWDSVTSSVSLSMRHDSDSEYCRRSKRPRLRPLFTWSVSWDRASRLRLRHTNSNKRFYLRYTMMIMGIGGSTRETQDSNFIKQRLRFVVTGIPRARHNSGVVEQFLLLGASGVDVRNVRLVVKFRGRETTCCRVDCGRDRWLHMMTHPDKSSKFP